MLSPRSYAPIGPAATASERALRDRAERKAQILAHLVTNGEQGTQLKELSALFPALNDRAVQRLLDELLREGTPASPVTVGRRADTLCRHRPPTRNDDNLEGAVGSFRASFHMVIAENR